MSINAKFFDGSGGLAQPEGVLVSTMFKALCATLTPSAGSPRQLDFLCPLLCAFSGRAKQSAGMWYPFLPQMLQCCFSTKFHCPFLLSFAGHAAPAVLTMCRVSGGSGGKPGGGVTALGWLGGWFAEGWLVGWLVEHSANAALSCAANCLLVSMT